MDMLIKRKDSTAEKVTQVALVAQTRKNCASGYSKDFISYLHFLFYLKPHKNALFYFDA